MRQDDLFEFDGLLEDTGDEIISKVKLKEILDKSVNDVRGLISNEAKSIIKEVHEAVEQLDGLKREIFTKRLELESLNSEIDDKTARFPRSLAMNYVRKYTKGFAPGDKVWKLIGKVIPCKVCKGEKKISAVTETGQNIKISCPECNGWGNKYINNADVEEDRVSDVVLKLVFRNEYNSPVIVWSADTVELCGDTRVKADILFATEEAREVANKNFEKAMKELEG